MIRVERGEAPAFVHEPEFVAARVRFESYRVGGGSRATQTFLDTASALGPMLPRVTEYVAHLFHAKCAYTELPVPVPTLHLHRPEADAIDQRQQSSPDHYWWTAFWYRNWYLASPDVAALKRNLFPVVGGVRAAPPGLEDRLLGSDVEAGFLDVGELLDPCEDHPQLHLDFQDDGTVSSWAFRGAPWLTPDQRSRGETTIGLLDLQDRRLQASRMRAIGVALRPAEDLSLPPAELLDPAYPHLGAARQVFARRLLEAGPPTMTPAHQAVLPELVPRLLAEPGRVSPGFVAQVADELRGTAPDLAALLDAPIEVAESAGAEPAETELPETELPETEPAATAPEPAGRTIPPTAAISRVVIRNFQAIEVFELDVPPAVEVVAPSPLTKQAVAPVGVLPQQPELRQVTPTGRPWRVFLGENGSGKSSALRALALALAGDEVDAVVEECDLDWSDLLRRGTEEGQVLVELTGGHSIDLTFTAAGPTPESRAALPRMEGFVRGFGATRLRSEAGLVAGDHVRLGNLFDPLQPVADAKHWLVDLAGRPDPGDFNVAAITVARLLGREEQVAEKGDPTGPRFIEVDDGEVLVRGEPLRTLSDGYQAIITLACDLMAGAGSGLSDMKNATGIVLVDELGCYLHPRWKMQITRTLRQVFPAMQFFVTTHEPLCLRGLVEREVVRVTPSSTEVGQPWHAVFEPIEESPSRYRVDRLLTSPFFGLGTTIDPEIEQQFLLYYQLIREADPTQDELRLRLRAELSQHGILGYTARDQLIYDAIDQYLAQSPRLEPEARRLQRQQTLDAVVDIWRSVAARRTGGGR